MATFNLHTVITDVEDVAGEIRKIVAEFHAALASIGHKVASSKLTGDAGTVDVTPAPIEPPAPVVAAPPVQHYDLNVEVNADGSVRVIPAPTNSPAATNPPPAR